MSGPGSPWLQRLALFLCALHRDQVGALLEGLADGPRAEARAFCAEVQGWDPARRQARLVMELGLLDRPEERLERLLEEAPVGLRAELVAAAPVALRPSRPRGARRPGCPALAALAARLVEEALRAR